MCLFRGGLEDEEEGVAAMRWSQVDWWRGWKEWGTVEEQGKVEVRSRH